MPLQAYCELFDEGGTCFISALVEEKLSVIGTRGQSTERAGRPIESIAFLSVLEACDLASTVLLLL